MIFDGPGEREGGHVSSRHTRLNYRFLIWETQTTFSERVHGQWSRCSKISKCSTLTSTRSMVINLRHLSISKEILFRWPFRGATSTCFPANIREIFNGYQSYPRELRLIILIIRAHGSHYFFTMTNFLYGVGKSGRNMGNRERQALEREGSVKSAEAYMPDRAEMRKTMIGLSLFPPSGLNYYHPARALSIVVENYFIIARSAGWLPAALPEEHLR